MTLAKYRVSKTTSKMNSYCYVISLVYWKLIYLKGIFVSNQGFYCVCQPCGKTVAKTLSGSLLLIFSCKYNYTECKVFPECLIHL